MLPMQEAIHDYVVNGKGTAKEALDKLSQSGLKYSKQTENFNINT